MRTTIWPMLTEEEKPRHTPQSELIHESFLVIRQNESTIPEIYNAIVETINRQLHNVSFPRMLFEFKYIQSDAELQERKINDAFFFILESEPSLLNSEYGVRYFVDYMAGGGRPGMARGAGLEMILTQGDSILPKSLQEILSRKTPEDDNLYIVRVRSSSETGIKDPYIRLDGVLVKVGEFVLYHLRGRSMPSTASLFHGFNGRYDSNAISGRWV